MMEYDRLPGVTPGPPLDEWRITSTRGSSVLFNFRRHVHDQSAALELIRHSFCETQIVAARQVHAEYPNQDWIIVEVLFTDEDGGAARRQAIARGIQLSPDADAHDDEVVYALPSCNGRRYTAFGVTNMGLQAPELALASYSALLRAMAGYVHTKHVWLHEPNGLYDGSGTAVCQEHHPWRATPARWVYDPRYPHTCAAHVYAAGCYFCCNVCRTLDHHDTEDHALVVLHELPRESGSPADEVLG